MGSLKEIRNRIASVKSTQKITGAMKLVSASKLRRAQTAIINLRPYSNKLNEILQNLTGSADITNEIPLFKVRRPEKVMIIAITSNRGLCGAFNSNVIKEVTRLINKKYAAQQQAGNVQLICIGKKANEQLRNHFSIEMLNETVLDNPNFSYISQLADTLINRFCEQKIDKIEIVYNRFINPATQKVVIENYLPVEKLTATHKAKQIDYIFEPSKQTLLEEMIPKILKLQLYKTLLDSIASEHGARMTAMAKATDNATEILKNLKLKYNNARQSAITNELNEIVGGANALNN